MRSREEGHETHPYDIALLVNEGFISNPQAYVLRICEIVDGFCQLQAAKPGNLHPHEMLVTLQRNSMSCVTKRLPPVFWYYSRRWSQI